MEVDGSVIEDRAWLRPYGDKRHINIVELEAAIRGLSLAVNWQAKHDSKTVASWLRDIVGNVRRTKTKGPHKVLVQRRLQIVSDLVITACMDVSVEWVPTDQNRADILTRVPPAWVKQCRMLKGDATTDDADVVAAAATLPSPVKVRNILNGQRADDVLQLVIMQLQNGLPVVGQYASMSSQLVIEDGVLLRSIKPPIEGMVRVPVVPEFIVADVVRSTHLVSGHGNWETMYRMIRSRCFFPAIASACVKFVAECTQCKAANPQSGIPAAPTRADIPGRPWSEVVIDTLELGTDRSGKYHCVLVCVDIFTKWVDVCPLRRHDAASVAAAFTSMCLQWGVPDVVRMDNGTEFVNMVVESLLQLLGVHVRTGAVRHPKSQGSAERFNRTLLGLIRKTLTDSSDWRADLEVLLFQYRNRPHSTTQISPMMAMSGWQPRHIAVGNVEEACSLSQWRTELSARAARVLDLIDCELLARDFIDQPEAQCGYKVGDYVLLCRPGRHQKRHPPYEPGWVVTSIIVPSTVVVAKLGGSQQPKTVNVDVLKPDPLGGVPAELST